MREKCPYCIAGTEQVWVSYPGTADAAKGGGHYETRPCERCGGTGEIAE